MHVVTVGSLIESVSGDRQVTQRNEDEIGEKAKKSPGKELEGPGL